MGPEATGGRSSATRSAAPENRAPRSTPTAHHTARRGTITPRRAARDKDGVVAPTGNQLQRQAPRAASPCTCAPGRHPRRPARPGTPARAAGPAAGPPPRRRPPPAADEALQARRQRRARRQLLLLSALAVATGMLTSTGPPGADGLPPATRPGHDRDPGGVGRLRAPTAVGSPTTTPGPSAASTPPRVRASGGPLHLGGRPISVVSGFGHLWVADIAGSQVWEVDPDDGEGGRGPHRRGPGAGVAGRRRRRGVGGEPAGRHRERDRSPDRPRCGRRRHCPTVPCVSSSAPTGCG